MQRVATIPKVQLTAHLLTTASTVATMDAMAGLGNFPGQLIGQFNRCVVLSGPLQSAACSIVLTQQDVFPEVTP